MGRFTIFPSAPASAASDERVSYPGNLRQISYRCNPHSPVWGHNIPANNQLIRSKVIVIWIFFGVISVTFFIFVAHHKTAVKRIITAAGDSILHGNEDQGYLLK